MKFYLANHMPCDLEEAFVSGTSKTLELDLTGFPTYSGGDVRLFDKFQKAFDRALPYPEIPREMSVDFIPTPAKQVSSGPASNLWTVTLKSDMLKVVYDELHFGNAEIALQIELGIQGEWSGARNGGYTKVDGFEPKKEANGVVSQNRYEKKQVIINMRLPNGYPRSWNLTIEVVGCDFACLAETLPSCLDLNRHFFNKKEFCDFEIISEDGTVIPCHKMFLCTKSSVFSQMLKDVQFMEARDNKMTIDDMSTRGINAMLHFLYCFDVGQAVVNCDVAFELLKAADKYDIQDLWNIVAKILAEQSQFWYSVDVALKLLSFAANCQRPESASLEKKMLKMLAMKSEQLPNSTVYSELFPTPVSRKMFMLALEEVKPGAN